MGKTKSAEQVLICAQNNQNLFCHDRPKTGTPTAQYKTAKIGERVSILVRTTELSDIGKSKFFPSSNDVGYSLVGGIKRKTTSTFYVGHLELT